MRARKRFPSSSRLFFVVALGLLLGTGPLWAQEDANPVTISADVLYGTRYLFAGIPFSGGGVFQPHVAVGASSFTFNFFSNYDLDTDEFNEFDIYADYFTMLSDIVGGYVGAALYNFKHVEQAGEFSLTPEIYAGLSIFTTLTPSIYVAHDFNVGDGTHVYLSLTHGVPVGSVTVSGTGRIEYNADYWRDGSSFGFADFNVSVDVPVGSFTVAPFMVFQAGLHDDFDDFVEGGVRLRADF